MSGPDRERTAALAVLGLTPAATAGQITAAYRRLARDIHPDRCADVDAAKRFAALSAAYRRATDSVPEPPAVPVRPVPTERHEQPPQEPAEPPLRVGPVHFAPWRGPRQGTDRRDRREGPR